jgi:hypothetical protein
VALGNAKGLDVANGWTSERRARQAEAIRRWQPWTRSTGPRTEAGKARTRLNAYRGGVRPMLRELSRVLREQRRELGELLG